MRHRFAALAAVAVSLGIAAPAGAQSPPSWLQYGSDGATAPQFDFAKAIEQTVWVESEVDSDRDGAKDLIRIRISRPGEAQERGYKVPVVYEHSPYRGNTGAPANHDVDFDYLPQERGAKATTSARAAVAPARQPRRLLRAARLCGRARRERRHVQLAGLPRRRRRRRDARHQG